MMIPFFDVDSRQPEASFRLKGLTMWRYTDRKKGGARVSA